MSVCLCVYVAHARVSRISLMLAMTCRCCALRRLLCSLCIFTIASLLAFILPIR